jgi:hypothetical protein
VFPPIGGSSGTLTPTVDVEDDEEEDEEDELEDDEEELLDEIDRLPSSPTVRYST